MRRWSRLVFIGAFLLTCSAMAEAEEKLLAVLPLDVSHTDGHMTKSASTSLEEMLRDTAVNSLGNAGWTVMSGENTIQILIDNGVDPSKCGDTACHLSMAREIKADKFLSGTVQWVDGEFSASFRLIDSRTGRIVASERVSGVNTKSLRESFEAKADAFFTRSGLRESKQVAEEKPVVTNPVVEAKPVMKERPAGVFTRRDPPSRVEPEVVAPPPPVVEEETLEPIAATPPRNEPEKVQPPAPKTGFYHEHSFGAFSGRRQQTYLGLGVFLPMRSLSGRAISVMSGIRGGERVPWFVTEITGWYSSATAANLFGFRVDFRSFFLKFGSRDPARMSLVNLSLPVYLSYGLIRGDDVSGRSMNVGFGLANDFLFDCHWMARVEVSQPLYSLMSTTAASVTSSNAGISSFAPVLGLSAGYHLGACK